MDAPSPLVSYLLAIALSKDAIYLFFVALLSLDAEGGI